MKTLTIGKEILDFRQKPVRLDQETESLTIKEALLRLIGSTNFNEDGQNGKRNIIGHKLGLKIYDCKELTMDLEDEEFKMLKECLKAKIFSCLIMGPLEEEIERAEKS